LGWLLHNADLLVGWLRRFLLVPAFTDPLTHEQDIHDDGEDEDENAPDDQNVVQDVHALALPASKGTASEILWQTRRTLLDNECPRILGPYWRGGVTKGEGQSRTAAFLGHTIDADTQ